MKREVSAAVLSDIAVAGLGHSLSAGRPGHPQRPRPSRKIVPTGDHAGPGTLRLDTDIGTSPAASGTWIFSATISAIWRVMWLAAPVPCISPPAPLPATRTAPFPSMERASTRPGRPSTTARSPCKSSSLTMTSSRGSDHPDRRGTGKYGGASGQLDVKSPRIHRPGHVDLPSVHAAISPISPRTRAPGIRGVPVCGSMEHGETHGRQTE
jgi:hypothetical protein